MQLQMHCHYLLPIWGDYFMVGLLMVEKVLNDEKNFTVMKRFVLHRITTTMMVMMMMMMMMMLMKKGS